MPGSDCSCVDVARKLAGVFGGDFLRGGVQLPRTAIVAEAFPQPQHLSLVGRGERVHIRKRRDEAFEVVADRGDLRLLQHDLADPDAVRIARLPPGQVAGVIGVPGEQTATQPLLFGGGEDVTQ